MMIILTLIALLFCLLASRVCQPEAATAEVVTYIPAVEATIAAVEISIGRENATGRRMADSVCAIGAANRQQTAAPPE